MIGLVPLMIFVDFKIFIHYFSLYNFLFASHPYTSIVCASLSGEFR